MFKKGHIVSKETRLKIGQANKGKISSPSTLFKKGMKPWNKGTKGVMKCWAKGKKLTVEHRKKLSEFQKNRFKDKTKHPRWIKDKSLLKKSERKDLDSAYMNWSRLVKDRDNWKCKISDENCKGRLEAHHILPWRDYNELRYQLNNGITLCLAHHPRKRSEEAKLSPYFQKLVAEMK